LEEIERIYVEARQQGIVFNYIWGGEPLVRADIDRVMFASKRNGLISLINTNGYFLPEWLDELANTMDILVVSIDYPSDYHDELRKCKGLYKRALEGIGRTKCKYPKIKVIINTVITRYNYHKIEELVLLAKDMGASIFLSPMETNSRLSSPELLSRAMLMDEEISQVILTISNAVKTISREFALRIGKAETTNIYGEEQAKLDIWADEYGRVFHYYRAED